MVFKLLTTSMALISSKTEFSAEYKPAVVTMFNGRNFNEQTEPYQKQ
ncbi:hypothetical protein AAULR_26056 [Lacticaseibacillus rhamnosus MTCC 5462]|nr:hypothetical protein AAULR_26056 [Lacticaseibacillus rhamnosus MTCC 5462]